MTSCATIAVCCALLASNPDATGVIEGTVLNGSRAQSPVAGAKVVLRASHQGAWIATAETTTDDRGRFRFEQIPVSRDVIYLPGANHLEIHYPGQRVTIDGRHLVNEQRIVVYETVADSPLVAARHEIDLRPEVGVLVVTETIVIANRSMRSYMGSEAADGQPSATLRLSIPPQFDKVTFDKEFFGRQFQLSNERLETQIPWTPGQRELKFTYRLPLEHRHWLFCRPLDLATQQLRVKVSGEKIDDVTCSFPATRTVQAGAIVFDCEAALLSAGHTIELKFGDLPVPWTTHARWIAPAALVLLVLATFAAMSWRRHRPGPSAPVDSVDSKPRTVKRAA